MDVYEAIKSDNIVEVLNCVSNMPVEDIIYDDTIFHYLIKHYAVCIDTFATNKYDKDLEYALLSSKNLMRLSCEKNIMIDAIYKLLCNRLRGVITLPSNCKYISYNLYKHQRDNVVWLTSIKNAIDTNTNKIVLPNEETVTYVGAGIFDDPGLGKTRTMYSFLLTVMTYNAYDDYVEVPNECGLDTCTMPVVDGYYSCINHINKLITKPKFRYGAHVYDLNPEDVHVKIDNEFYYRSYGALIVVPHNLTRQWMSEYHKQFSGKRIITVLQKIDIQKLSIEDLVYADIIIATSHLFKSSFTWKLPVIQSNEFLKRPTNIYFQHLVVDEVHLLKEHIANMPPSKYRWIMTGTPAETKDKYSSLMPTYLSTLLKSYNRDILYNFYVMNSLIIPALFKKSTKESIESEIRRNRITYINYPVELRTKERSLVKNACINSIQYHWPIYTIDGIVKTIDMAFTDARNDITEAIALKNKEKEYLSDMPSDIALMYQSNLEAINNEIRRLQLNYNRLEENMTLNDCFICAREYKIDEGIHRMPLSCSHVFCLDCFNQLSERNNITCPLCSTVKTIKYIYTDKTVQTDFEALYIKFQSTRMAHVVMHLISTVQQTDKCVVYSHYMTVLEDIYRILYGKMNITIVKNSSNITNDLKRFESGDYCIILMRVGGLTTGIDIGFANKLVLLEPVTDSTIKKQIVNRLDRISHQDKEITVTTFMYPH